MLKRSVTLTGDDFNPSGTLTGGSRNKSSTVLSQLQELCEAEGQLHQHKEELKRVQHELDALQVDATKYVYLDLAKILLHGGTSVGWSVLVDNSTC